MLNKKTVDDLQVKGKRVLVRCDFNVPLQDGVITDENRITAALPTIKKLIADGGKVILCSHMGKPKGEAKPELSLAPVAKRLSELLEKEVVFAKDDNVVGENAKAAELSEKSYILRRDTLGESHPDTVTSLSNLSVYMQNLDKIKTADDYTEEKDLKIGDKKWICC